jgi:hypothetical protein
MHDYEVMSDSHFILKRKALAGAAWRAAPAAAGQERINAENLLLQPGESAVFEWTSAAQAGREITLLVVVGALVAIAAATFIEALRFWLLLLVGAGQASATRE